MEPVTGFFLKLNTCNPVPTTPADDPCCWLLQARVYVWIPDVHAHLLGRLLIWVHPPPSGSWIPITDDLFPSITDLRTNCDKWPVVLLYKPWWCETVWSAQTFSRWTTLGTSFRINYISHRYIYTEDLSLFFCYEAWWKLCN